MSFSRIFFEGDSPFKNECHWLADPARRLMRRRMQNSPRHFSNAIRRARRLAVKSGGFNSSDEVSFHVEQDTQLNVQPPNFSSIQDLPPPKRIRNIEMSEISSTCEKLVFEKLSDLDAQTSRRGVDHIDGQVSTCTPANVRSWVDDGCSWDNQLPSINACGPSYATNNVAFADCCCAPNFVGISQPTLGSTAIPFQLKESMSWSAGQESNHPLPGRRGPVLSPIHVSAMADASPSPPLPTLPPLRILADSLNLPDELLPGQCKSSPLVPGGR